ncbi:MAG: ring-cleaving dioxygenase [Trueperaceae bacterium]
MTSEFFPTVQGLHHITCIASDAQKNLDFYAGILGMRLVKKSVNQDDPSTYHLFYADAEGRPGTDLTFFPWQHMQPARKGVGLSTEIQLAVQEGSLPYWQERFAKYGVKTHDIETRFGERALPFQDNDGLELALVEILEERAFTPWEKSAVPADKQIIGLHGARMWQRTLEPSANFLLNTMGFQYARQEKGWHRHTVNGGGSGNFVDIKELPDLGRGQWGTGSIHHLAWRVNDTEHEMHVREKVATAGRRPTEQIDRFWFKSVYFMEPGGVLFELATDGPGFAVDEEPGKLGETLVLPPWLEPHRTQIEAGLPKLVMRNEG